MKRYSIIFITTVVLVKLLASSLARMSPPPDFTFEKNVFHKVVTLFNNADKDAAVAPQVTVPQFHGLPAVKAVKPLAMPTPVQSHTLVEANKKINTTKSEQERRKERKKKLEQAQTNKKANQLIYPQVPQMPSFKPEAILTSDTKIMMGVTFAPANKDKVTDTPTTTSTTPNTQAPKQPVDINNWKKILLATPTNALFKSFLALYKGGQITSTQYYSVLQALEKSSDPAARKLAVMGASVEANESAFQILAYETYEESDKTIQAAAAQRLQVYANTQYFPIMASALPSGDITTKMAVTQIIDTVALSIKANPKSMTPATKKWFTQFAADFTLYIKSTVATSSTQNLLASTHQALTNIEAILAFS